MENNYKGSMFIKVISKDEYFCKYLKDTDIMECYENVLKNVNINLSLNTGLKDLPQIFPIIENWDNTLRERYNNAPSKDLAKNLFENELLSHIEFDENAEFDSDKIKGKYWNKYRKIAYNHCLKGQNVTLQGLGYLMLREVCNDIDGYDDVLNISCIYDVKGALISLAEGAALAYYLHNKTGEGLTAFEIALRHWYLVKAKVEPWINAKQVGEKYAGIKSWKNIQDDYLALEHKPPKRNPNKTHLENVCNSLSDFPEIQKAIMNDLAKIN